MEWGVEERRGKKRRGEERRREGRNGEELRSGEKRSAEMGRGEERRVEGRRDAIRRKERSGVERRAGPYVPALEPGKAGRPGRRFGELSAPWVSVWSGR